jgi:hypothetical protein
MFSVLGASVFLPFLPMTAIQVLTNNLLYDFSQTTIPTDNVDAEYLAVPRRWDIINIAKFALFIGPISSIFDYVTYFVMLYGFNAWTNPALFQTGWFVESAHSDAHHPYHPNGEDSVPGKPRQYGAHRHDHHHRRDRYSPALYLVRRISGLHRAAYGLLDRAQSDPPELCDPDAFREDMVYSTVRVELNDRFTVGLTVADGCFHLYLHCSVPGGPIAVPLDPGPR